MTFTFKLPDFKPSKRVGGSRGKVWSKGDPLVKYAIAWRRKHPKGSDYAWCCELAQHGAPVGTPTGPLVGALLKATLLLSEGELQ